MTFLKSEHAGQSCSSNWILTVVMTFLPDATLNMPHINSATHMGLVQVGSSLEYVYSPVQRILAMFHTHGLVQVGSSQSWVYSPVQRILAMEHCYLCPPTHKRKRKDETDPSLVCRRAQYLSKVVRARRQVEIIRDEQVLHWYLFCFCITWQQFYSSK